MTTTQTCSHWVLDVRHPCARPAAFQSAAPSCDPLCGMHARGSRAWGIPVEPIPGFINTPECSE